jgi:hypothetical protein
VNARIDLYFTQYFDVSPKTLAEYGAFDISVVSDLPLFIDPFLLFNSKNPEYKELHERIIAYLTFLRDKADRQLEPALIDSWYRFKEVKQNWLGFTVLGNAGSGLGKTFAAALHSSLGSILRSFGTEQITQGSHLEKLALIKEGVGRDNISDFTTNLIKGYLLEYTQEFAHRHLKAEQRGMFAVPRAAFNYDTEFWETRQYELPILHGDFVLLTPADLLTRDDTWISRSDMIRGFHHIPESIDDAQLRAQVNNYLRSRLGKKPTDKEYAAAAQATIQRFPEVIDYYIRQQEDRGDQAAGLSAQRREETAVLLVDMVQRAVAAITANTTLYSTPLTSYDEALARARGFKRYVEDSDGYKLLNRQGVRKPFSREQDVQLFFGLIFFGSEFDVNREVNNGRGPVDFKVSKGAVDKSLIEVKLASNSALKRNLERQVAIYEKANDTRTSVKVIVFYTAAEERKVQKILKELDLAGEPSIVLIDARADSKPSGSKA